MIRLLILPLILLLSLWASAQENRPVVILGAGPTGLISALELAEAGVKNILVLEKRLPHSMAGDFKNIQFLENTSPPKNPWGSRERNIALDARAMTRLNQLGVSFPIYPIEGVHFHDGMRNRSGYLNFDSLAGNLLQKFINRDFAGASTLRDVEWGLLQKISQIPQIQVVFGAEVEVLSESIKILNGESPKEVTFQHLVLASGRHTEKLVQSHWKPLLGTKTESWHLGNFINNSPHQRWSPGYHFASGDSVKNLGFMLAVDSGVGYTTVYINTDQQSNPEEVLRQAGRILQVPGYLEKIESFQSTPGELSDVEIRSGGRWIPMGDARFSHDPASGAGVSIAFRTAQALGASVVEGEIQLESFLENVESVRREWSVQSQWSTLARSIVRQVSSPMGLISSFFSRQEPRQPAGFNPQAFREGIQRLFMSTSAPRCSTLFRPVY